MSREGRARWGFNERFVIGKPGNPMLERWRLLQTPWFGIYVHFIYREDLDPVCHDHPWAFWSWVLRGGYTELVQVDPRSTRWDDQYLHSHNRFSLHSFPLANAHRITHVQPKTVTLVLVGRKQRVWGFYIDDEWVDYCDALHLRPTEGPGGKRAGTRLTDHAAVS